jgi:hypothetical protein
MQPFHLLSSLQQLSVPIITIKLWSCRIENAFYIICQTVDTNNASNRPKNIWYLQKTYNTIIVNVILNINAVYSLIQTYWKWIVSDKHLSKHISVNVTSLIAVTEYLLSFGPPFLVYPFAIQKHKDYNTQNCNLHVCTVHQQYQTLYYPTNALSYTCIIVVLLKPVNV